MFVFSLSVFPPPPATELLQEHFAASFASAVPKINSPSAQCWKATEKGGWKEFNY